MDIAQAAAQPAFRDHLVDMLVKICEIDTTPQADVARFAANEAAIFDILESDIQSYGLDQSRLERRPMNPDIDKHPFFSQLYYTKSPDQPDGLSAAECYKGRSNMLLFVDGEQASDAGRNFALNAHIDVIAPYIPPSVKGDTVFGRGACDDKGNVVAMMGALKLVGEYLKATGKKLNKNLTCMFVLDEESGGNGSLSLAIDRDLKKNYDSLMVLEICENRLFPANRGAVWYKVEAKLPGANLFEAAAYIIAQMEAEGRSIRAESRHDLFPHRPVQTCHGIIGNWGGHPSRINGKAAFDIVIDGPHAADARTMIGDIIQFALDEYCGVYGDKTKVNDKTTGKPKVDHHYDFEEADHGFTVTVHGATGHMGSIFENDGAITKMMTMARALMRSREAISRVAGGDVTLRLNGWDDVSHLILEGGQGFLPTHELEEVQTRLTRAVHRGAEQYLRTSGRKDMAADLFKVTFEKLHNAAFDGDPDSPDMRNAIECAKKAGIWEDQPIRGWDVSCDSRIFAKEYPDLTVLTTGPGSLIYAHGDQEQIDIPEMIKAAEFLAYYILKQTGTA
jgi:acetylornithine deacetylase/succinyl-diaminopimelate desuccinylase-like protein